MSGFVDAEDPPKRTSVVMIVDDDRLLLSMLGRHLSIRLGVEIDSVDDPTLAVAKCAQRAYDVIVLDIEMPRLDGISLARALRREGHTMPIVFCSGALSGVDASVLAELAPAVMLAKPARPDDLVRVIGERLPPDS